MALAAYPELKNVILVDEDVDVFDSDDVLWAMQTGCRATWTSSTCPGWPGTSSTRPRPAVQPAPARDGVTNKTIFDCTAPFHLRDEFVRAPFQDVDPTPWL